MDAYLRGLGFMPSEYMRLVKSKAKSQGYSPTSISFAEDGIHKFQIIRPDGLVRRFGRVGYGDFLIWSFLERQGSVPLGTAATKRRVFHASHERIKGRWRNDPFSPNALALRLLW